MLLRFVKSLGASRGEIRDARGVAVGRSCKAPEAITTGGRVAGSGPRLSARSTVHASNPIRLRFVGWRAAKMHRRQPNATRRTNWAAAFLQIV